MRRVALPSLPSRAVRRRHPPRVTRQKLLRCAELLIAERGPDGVTLRQVGQAAGVTPGLVTHYFGTYAALVGAVQRRHGAATRRRLSEAIGTGQAVPDAATLLRILFEAMSEPLAVRLFAWAALRRSARPARTHGIRAVVDALESAFRRSLPIAEAPPRDRIEMVVMLALSATHGYAIGKQSWLSELGVSEVTAARDQAFLQALTATLRHSMSGQSVAP